MLPLETFLLVPSLFVTPLAAVVLSAARKRPAYARCWRSAIVVCVLLIALFTVMTLTAPLYSDRDHRPANPGGFSSSPGIALMELAFWTCVVIPAFPVLIVLGMMSPQGQSRLPSLVASLLVVGACGALIVQKNLQFWADYREEKSKPRQTPFEQFEHLR